MGSFVNFLLPVTRSNMIRVTNIAVNILASIPIESVTPKPLIGPVPNLNNSIAAISVVMLESNIVVNAL